MTTASYLRLSISAVLHLMVDGLCMCCLVLMAAMVSRELIVASVAVYNATAFLTQPLTGMLADRTQRRHWLLLAADVLLLAAVAMAMAMSQCIEMSQCGAAPMLTAIALLLGAGNSLFHVWGGKQTAVETGNDMRALGFFVSTGAFGLALGMLFCSWPLLLLFMVAVSVLSGVYISSDQRAERQTADGASACGISSVPFVCLAMAGLMAFVMLRSHVGGNFASHIERTEGTILLIGVVTMAGKMAGGWIARRMGIVPALLLILATVAASLVLAQRVGMGALLTGLFAINLTMPITLYLANRVLPGREGLAFGLLAAALMTGVLVVPLLLTVVIEGVVLLLLGERDKRVLLASVAINIATNAPLNLIITHVSSSVATIIVGETVVVVVEALCYYWLLRSWRQAFAYSILCNAMSFLVGLLLELLYIRFIV